MLYTMMVGWGLLALGFLVLGFGPGMIVRHSGCTYREAWDLSRRTTYGIWLADVAAVIALSVGAVA